MAKNKDTAFRNFCYRISKIGNTNLTSVMNYFKGTDKYKIEEAKE